MQLLSATYSDLVRLSDVAVQSSAVQLQPRDGAKEEATTYFDAAVNSRQHGTYLALLHHLACSVAIQAADVSARFFKREELLAQTVASKTAVPTEQVYPQFMEFFQLYEKLRVLVTTLERANALYGQLKALAVVHASFVAERAHILQEATHAADTSPIVHNLWRRHTEFASSVYMQTMRSVGQFQKYVAWVLYPSCCKHVDTVWMWQGKILRACPRVRPRGIHNDSVE